MKLKDRQTIKEALLFIKNFGEHRHLKEFPNDCSHCILLAKLKKILAQKKRGQVLDVGGFYRDPDSSERLDL